MASYKVIALNVAGMGNKIHYLNDIVKDSAFPPGHAEQLVKEGFLKPYEEQQEEKAMDPGTDAGKTGGQEETPTSDPPAGEDVKPETPAPPADLGRELADKAKGAKTPAKK